MKAKSLWKRAFALALTVVMLVSCWVFSAPQANAGDTYYTIRFYCKCSNDYSPGTQSFTITYKENNGTGTTKTTSAINIPNTDNWFTSWGSSTGYAPSSSGTTVNGFPTSFNVTFNKASGGGTKGTNTNIRIEILKNGSWTTLMTANDASLKGTGDFTTSGSLSGTGDYPRPTTDGTCSFSDVTFPASGSATASISAPSVVDQYGVNYKTANFSVSSASSTYSSCTPTCSGTTVTIPTQVATSGVNSQTITATCCWKSGSSSGNRTFNKSFTVTDHTYTATYKYYTTNTSNLASPTENSCTASNNYKAYYGEVPGKPSSVPTTSYYTNEKHWSGGSYGTQTAITADRNVWPTYSTNGVAHTGWVYQSNGTKNASGHTVKCGSCAYTKITAHTSAADAAVAATCTATGLTAGAHCSVCNYVITAQSATAALGHVSVTDAAVAATCTSTGKTAGAHCSRCNAVLTAQTTTAALGHTGADVAKTTTATDGGAKITYYECDRCHTSWGATYVPATHTYEKDTQNEQAAVNGEANIAAVETNTSTENMMAPAPAFNNFSVTYDSGAVQGVFPYANRLSQLKLEHDNAAYVDKNTTQALRFAGAVSVPAGVSLAVGSTEITDNVVTDFGFVYTQDRYISNADVLVIGGTTDIPSSSGKVYEISKYSVKDANSGVFNGSNWTGVTQRGDNGHYSLTFNLLLSIYAKNWNRAYAARPYITYKYHGVEYTVYDEGTTTGTTGRTYSCASVAYIATHVVANSAEPLATRNYIQSKIVDHLAEQSGYTANPEK